MSYSPTLNRKNIMKEIEETETGDSVFTYSNQEVETYGMMFQEFYDEAIEDNSEAYSRGYAALKLTEEVLGTLLDCYKARAEENKNELEGEE